MKVKITMSTLILFKRFSIEFDGNSEEFEKLKLNLENIEI